MNLQGIKTFDILHKHELDIPDVVQRVEREKTSGNVLIFISGKAQTGKSNTGLWLAYALTPEPIITFNVEDFFRIASDTTLTNKVIVYDEAQQDVKNWWDVTYKTMKQILESYGYLHHVLIVISPRIKNLYGMFDLFHFLIKMRKEWYSNRFSFTANFYLLDQDLKGKNIFVGFQTKQIPDFKKINPAAWDIYMRQKQENYNRRVSEWISKYQRYKGNPKLDYQENIMPDYIEVEGKKVKTFD